MSRLYSLAELHYEGILCNQMTLVPVDPSGKRLHEKVYFYEVIISNGDTLLLANYEFNRRKEAQLELDDFVSPIWKIAYDPRGRFGNEKT